MTVESPYGSLAPDQWADRTMELAEAYPLDMKEAVDVILGVWEDVLSSGFGQKPFRIGTDLFPKPQIMAFFLHELVPLELGIRHPGLWRGDTSSNEKDLVHIPDPSFSAEIKCSSHPVQIFGNRSYAQKPTKKRKQKKSKSGFYFTVNFEKITPRKPMPSVVLVRFGWLDHSDWTGQKAATGQQASLSAEAYTGKLLVLYTTEKEQKQRPEALAT